MRVAVVRDTEARPGAVEWVDHGDGEQVFVFAATGVTELGAQALERAWAAFVDAGVWRWREPGGEPIGVTYHRSDEPGLVVEARTRPGEVDVWLSSRHFCWATVNSLQVSVRDCVGGGWSYHRLQSSTAAA